MVLFQCLFLTSARAVKHRAAPSTSQTLLPSQVLHTQGCCTSERPCWTHLLARFSLPPRLPLLCLLAALLNSLLNTDATPGVGRQTDVHPGERALCMWSLLTVDRLQKTAHGSLGISIDRTYWHCYSSALGAPEYLRVSRTLHPACVFGCWSLPIKMLPHWCACLARPCDSNDTRSTAHSY
jgi:hypothetical protein